MARDLVPGLGERIKAARSAAGLTQGQVAERSGVVPQSLSAFEQGRHTPSVAVLMRLAGAIGVKTGELIPEAGEAEQAQTPTAPPPTASSTPAIAPPATKPKRAPKSNSATASASTAAGDKPATGARVKRKPKGE